MFGVPYVHKHIQFSYKMHIKYLYLITLVLSQRTLKWSCTHVKIIIFVRTRTAYLKNSCRYWPMILLIIIKQNRLPVRFFISLSCICIQKVKIIFDRIVLCAIDIIWILKKTTPTNTWQTNIYSLKEIKKIKANNVWNIESFISFNAKGRT